MPGFPRPLMFHQVFTQSLPHVTAQDYADVNLAFLKELEAAGGEAVDEARSEGRPMLDPRLGGLGVWQTIESVIEPESDQAKAHYRGLGFDAERPIHETVVVFRGSENIDLIEHIVRDRLQIYRGPHGRRLAMVGHLSYRLSNVIHPAPEMVMRHETGLNEVIVEIDKPGPPGKIQYAAFRHDVFNRCRDIEAAFPGAKAMVLQRKLGYGSTGHPEFTVRIREVRPSTLVSALVKTFPEATSVAGSRVIGP